MARFCGSCGAPLPDGARVCGQCGIPVADDALGFEYTSPEKKEKRKQLIKRAVICAAIIAVIALVASIVPSFIGYRNVVRKAMKAYRDYDISALVNMSSEIYDYFDSESYVESYFEDRVSSDLDRFENQLGHDCKIKYEITDSYQLSDRRFRQVIDDLEYIYEGADDFISKIQIVEIEVTASRSKKNMKISKELHLTREENGWKILYLN